jgi:hypothetical protein
VVKTRASLHQSQIRQFTITPNGITLKDEIPADPLRKPGPNRPRAHPHRSPVSVSEGKRESRPLKADSASSAFAGVAHG